MKNNQITWLFFSFTISIRISLMHSHKLVGQYMVPQQITISY